MTNNVFTLEALEEEIERQYAPFRLSTGSDEFVLRSLLRVSKKERETVVDKLQVLDTEDGAELNEAETLEVVHTVLKTVTADGKGSKLIKVLGDDLLRCMKVLEKWIEATQPGEAENSPS